MLRKGLEQGACLLSESYHVHHIKYFMKIHVLQKFQYEWFLALQKLVVETWVS